ncbi:hypothetical protein [Paenibacillus radicis (ex Gao et al. 2016)]|uniref:Uncharacterized protein n=1 Tax=Paenibacillus radicis (ex Gao et al. 2016) TaxID=1737354 RepID=A0A917H1S2_9BACL|nr:hypothetical protein [Paenibacillus radicis (ex Gao et al. 2016)]GGG64810.1 hypothetical protein GCM10010918_18690 [Paenibacillus radicis (ex Gao et al. 2016)]
MNNPTNRINKYLFYLGISIAVAFLGALLLLSFYDQKPKYTLLVYNVPNNSEDFQQKYMEEINDPKHRISGYSIGVMDMPDKRIHVVETPLYVLMKIKNREIMFVTDRLNKLNEYVINEIK